MHEEKTPYIVFGGGPAGLSAAYYLTKSGYKVILIEKKSILGGLAATVSYKDSKVDFGPHAYHCKQDEIDELFKEFCHNEYNEINMKASLLLQGCTFDYPLKFGEALIRLKLFTSFRMIWDYGVALLKRVFTRVPEDNFKAWGIKRYGKTVFDLAFGIYSEKVWGMDTSNLNVKLAQQKLPDLNVVELIKEALGGRGAKQKILYSSYAYPKKGIGTIYNNLGKYIVENGGQVYSESTPSEIEFKNNKIQSVTIKTKEGEKNIPCQCVINTVPLKDLVPCFKSNIDSKYIESAKKLYYRNLIMVYLEVKRSTVTKDIMIYLLDSVYKFNRFSEQKNLCFEMGPKDKSVISFELCTGVDDDEWNMSEEELIDQAKKELFLLAGVEKDSILGGFVHRLENAYPVYDWEFDKNLANTIEFVESVDNLYSIGRQGLFINNDMHTSLKMGFQVSNSIIDNQPKKEWNQFVRKYLNWRLT